MRAIPIGISFLFMWITNIGLLFTALMKDILVWLMRSIEKIGDITMLLYRISIRIPLVVRNPAFTMQQIFYIGITSIPLIFVASLFTGAVTAESIAFQFKNFIILVRYPQLEYLHIAKAFPDFSYFFEMLAGDRCHQ